MVRRVQRVVESNVAANEAVIAAIRNDAAQRHASSGARETAGEPPLTRAEATDIEYIESRNTELRADLERLSRGEITQLAPDGVARELAAGAMAGLNSTLLREIVVARYQTPDELSSQIMQRYGQAFHLIVLGSAGAATIGKVSFAAAGGASNASTPRIIGTAAAALAMGAFGAGSHQTAESAKMHRREEALRARQAAAEGGGPPAGASTTSAAATQLGRGVISIVQEVDAQRKALHATQDANAALGRLQATLATAATVMTSLHTTVPSNPGSVAAASSA